MSLNNALARREARRRKILENSENRLKRITGESCELESSKDHFDVEYDFVENRPLNGRTCLKEQTTNSLDPTNLLKIENEDLGLGDNLTQNNAPKTPGFLEMTNNEVPPVESVNQNKDSRKVYMIVAIILRILVEFDVIHTSLNSLPVIFFLTKVGLSSVYGLQVTETSRLLGSFMIISGISSQKTNILIFVTNIFSNSVTELGFFIFMFVVCEMCVAGFKCYL